jgi:hypothetical protein
MLLKMAMYELGHIDHFLELINEAKESRQTFLEELAASKETQEPDDLLVDDFAQLDYFSELAAEFTILGLWRCVELYRSRAMSNALGRDVGKGAFNNKEFVKQLARLGIQENRIRCARSVDELRCLNNAIKHERCVGEELSAFKCWQKKKWKDFGDMQPHYSRLRPLAQRYLEDLTNCLCRWWKKRGA